MQNNEGRRLRAALVVRTCGPGAGIAGYSYNLATKVASEIDLTVCALRLNPPDGVKPNFRFRKVSALGDNLWTHLATFDRGVRKVLPRNVDVIHSQGGEAVTGDVVTMNFCYRAYQRRQIDEMVKGREWFAKRFNPLTYMDRWFEYLQVRPGGARRIICVSEGLKREFLEAYSIDEKRVLTIPNGVDLERFSPDKREASRAEILSRHSLEESDFLIVFTGFDFPRKGLDIVIRAIGIMREKNARLLVLGGKDDDGSYSRLAMDSGVENRLHILGPVFDVEKYYAAADCYCMPSKYEAFSLATLEAGATGLPLVTTRINGTEELVTPDKNGYFVERDPEDVSHRLDVLAGNIELRRSMGAAARQATKRFSWEHIAAATLAVYRNVDEEKGVAR
ncbi:MAG: glycosyltransferase family 1 protein [Planctomycetota bacterium]|nr:MAG: glycosyltransferase family 1 protein [Planctomycetota bacterium]